MTQPSRILHVITGLAPGGAETMLVRLLEELGDHRRSHSVISLRERWSLVDRLEELEVPVQALGMSGKPAPGEILGLARALRSSQADVIQTWMLHPNVLVGLLARAGIQRVPVVWGVHLSEVDRSTLGTRTAMLQRFEAACSWIVPSRIVACSFSSQEAMARLRYRRRGIRTIPNGFDLDRFRPDAEARDEIRAELGISPSTVVIGHVGRYHPVKDHPTLLRAANQVVDRASDVRFVLCGWEVEPSNPVLRPFADALGDRVMMLGQRADVPRMLNAFDLLVSSSSSEALSLAIGEAMATGVPVVATRCGDAPELIADTGSIVPIGDPAALADAIVAMIEMDPAARRELGRRARAWISSRYSLNGMAERYRAVWAEVDAHPDREHPAPG
jgi:glycosyltransferase involved in cell wall biosynthesis